MEIRNISTLQELHEVAQTILASFEQGSVAHTVALSGDLGAGKTAFVKELAKLLGVVSEVTSPTFVIMKSYEIHEHAFLKTLTHIDAYRIEEDDEMRVLGFNELLQDQTRIVCIEWPEKIENLIPQNAYHISLTLNQDGTRTVSYGN